MPELTLRDGFNRGEIQGEMAHQPLNDRTAQPVIRIQLNPPEYGQLTAVERAVIRIERFEVLIVGRADLADRRDTESEHVALRKRRIALEIPVQSAFPQGNSQIVFRFGEMIHSDENVARIRQRANRQRQNLQTRFGRRQIRFRNTPLRFEQTRQMRIIVDGQPVRRASVRSSVRAKLLTVWRGKP